jgi:putative oxidoreductase
MFEAYLREKLGPLTLRLALGLVCVYHGYLKIMMAGGTAWYPGWPTGWQVTIAWGEFAAGLAILVGLRCRLAAALVLALTLGTLIGWQGWNVLQLPLRSLEWTLLLLLVGLALLFLGAGELSLDGRAGANMGTAGKAAKKK